MNPITVLALGPGSREYLTLGAIALMRQAEKLILRTGENDCAAYLREEGIPFETLDALYDRAEDFEELNGLCVKRVLEAAEASPVVYAVPDPERDETVQALFRAGAVSGAMPGVPLSAPALALSGPVGPMGARS